MNYYDNVLDLIGHTPLIKLNRLNKGLKPLVLAKMENLNPGFSVKDRIGVSMVEAAERAGVLKPGGTIVEATSGNTGIGLAIVAAVKGYKCIFVMTDKASVEKSRYLKALGADVVITPVSAKPGTPDHYVSTARRIASETPNSFYPDQYSHPANPEAHYASTGPEIWEQTDGKITHFIAGMGTGGTISGTAKVLKEKNPQCTVVGVDPEGSILAKVFNREKWSWGDSHPYKVEGIGEDFVPRNLLFECIDSVVTVSDRESFLMGRRLTREEGLFCGGSSGTAVEGALRYARERQLGENDLIVVLLPDAGEIYLSKMYSDEWMRQNQFLGRSLPVGEILKSKTRPLPELLSVELTSTVRNAIETMNQSGVSQLPVFDKGNLVGSLSETALFQKTMETPEVRELTVGALLEPPFPTVGPDEHLRAERARRPSGL